VKKGHPIYRNFYRIISRLKDYSRAGQAHHREPRNKEILESPLLSAKTCRNKFYGRAQQAIRGQLRRINLFKIRLFYSLASPIHTIIFAFKRWYAGVSFAFSDLPVKKTNCVTEMAKPCNNE